MRVATSTSLAALLCSLPSISGFRNTHTLLAWAPSSSAGTVESFHTVAGSASLQYNLERANAEGEPCVPALVVSAPGLAHDDLNKMAFVKLSFKDAAKNLHLPYFQGPSVDHLKYMVERRLAHCETPTRFVKAKQFVYKHRESRDEWLQDLDTLVQNNLEKLPSDHIVLLSSVPDLGAHYRSKRQLSDAEWKEIEDVAEDSDLGIDVPSSQSGGSIFEDNSYIQPSASQSGTNNTIDPNSGLLFRYSFTSPALIFGSLIMLLILIPAVLLATNALNSIEIYHGLEKKMIGGQLGETKKDQ